MRGLAIHGGRVREARSLFPGAPEPWIDLSTGVNPWPYPASFASLEQRMRLPDPWDIEELETAAAAAFGLPAASILAVAGAEAGIGLLSASRKTRSVAVVEPTYSGHRTAWSAAGADVQAIGLDDLESAIETFDVVIVAQPNNPDGATVLGETIIALAHAASLREGRLIVDEAFVDQDPALSVTNALRTGRWPTGLVTLRSFGKFFGLPGVRLGFIAAHPDAIVRFRRSAGGWPVSADAIAAGIQAYKDQIWAQDTRQRLLAAAQRLDRLLTSAGYEVLGGTKLFRLTSVADAANRFRRLAELGILTRPFANAASWLRFGLPPASQWSRLEEALLETRT